MMQRRRELMGMQGVLKTVSGPIVTVNDALARNAKSLVLNFAPIQASGTPSPDNVLPISGWTGVNVGHAGSNEYDSSDNTADKYIDQSGAEITNTSWDLTGYLDVSSCRIVYYKGITQAGNAPYSAWYNSQKQLISTFKQQTGVNIIGVPPGAAYVRFPLYHYQDYDNRPTFQFYSGTTYPVDWTDTAGTVYGGYVDLVSGVLVATYGYADLGTLTWRYDTTGKIFVSTTVGAKSVGIGNVPKLLCETYVTVASASSVAWGVNPGDKITSIVYDASWIVVRDFSFGDSVSDFKTAISGTKAVFELKTPITYQLTPQTIAMLKGTNNVWSNANGNVELTYYAQ